MAKNVAYEPDHTINGVAITEVNGAGAAGNRELASALARVHDRCRLTGAPRLSRQCAQDRGRRETVRAGRQGPEGSLRWTVKAPDGRVLDVVEQANHVPAGSLDSGWGEGADHAAQDIFDLVDKLR